MRERERGGERERARARRKGEGEGARTHTNARTSPTNDTPRCTQPSQRWILRDTATPPSCVCTLASPPLLHDARARLHLCSAMKTRGRRHGHGPMGRSVCGSGDTGGYGQGLNERRGTLAREHAHRCKGCLCTSCSARTTRHARARVLAHTRDGNRHGEFTSAIRCRV